MSGAVFLCLLGPFARAQEAPVASVPGDTPPAQLLAEANAEWLAKLYIYVHKTYPDLARPTVDLINREHPQFWAFATARLEELAPQRDQALPAKILERALEIIDKVRPDLSPEILDFINERFPLLMTESQEIVDRTPPGQDPRPEIAALVAEKYPMLIADIRDEILVKHPRVLSEIFSALAKNWPSLFGDVVKRVHRQYPKLAIDLFAMALQKHPELSEVAGKILRGEMPEQEEPAPDAQTAAAHGPEPEAPAAEPETEAPPTPE